MPSEYTETISIELEPEEFKTVCAILYDKLLEMNSLLEGAERPDPHVREDYTKLNTLVIKLEKFEAL